jgi:hypothetical protein
MDDELLRTKTDEMLEILLERDLLANPQLRTVIMESCRAEIEEKVRTFYAETGEWPAFKKHPYGGLTMGTQAEIDQLPPPPPLLPIPSPLSEETLGLQREDKELRAALRNAYFKPPRMRGVETWAKQAGMTAEEFINTEIDAHINSGWGEVFQIFHANHGRFPDSQTEKNEAAEEWRKGAEDWRKGQTNANPPS